MLMRTSLSWASAVAVLLLLRGVTCAPADCDRCFECGPGTHEEDGVCVPDDADDDDDDDANDDDAANDDDVADDDDSAPADDDDATDDDDVADDDDAVAGCDDWIVFVSRPTGTNQIWRMHSDGTEATEVTVGGGSKSYPALSPDCSQVLYVDTAAWELRVTDLDGGNDTLVRAATGDEQIRGGTWSPDGLRIAFDSTLPGPSRALWTADADGTNATNVTDGTEPSADPHWSPDGASLAFARGTWPSAIATLPAGGGTATDVTDDGGGDSAPKWSPDGGQLIFQSSRGGGSHVFVVEASGDNLTQVTDEGEERPCFSPDGDQIVFRSDRDGASEIYVGDADGTNLVRLTDNDVFDGGPDWR